jgi:hypothetical protein
MRKIAFILIILFLFIVPMTYILYAQDTDEQISTVTLNIVPACKLTITDENVSKEIQLGDESRGDFGEGFVEFPSNKPTLTLNSNNNWKLSVRSTGFTGPYDKPVGDLMLKDLSSQHVTNGFNTFKSLSGNDQEVASYNKGVKAETHPCQYKALLDWEKDIPGTYSATVTYTLTTNAS